MWTFYWYSFHISIKNLGLGNIIFYLLFYNKFLMFKSCEHNGPYLVLMRFPSSSYLLRPRLAYISNLEHDHEHYDLS